MQRPGDRWARRRLLGGLAGIGLLAGFGCAPPPLPTTRSKQTPRVGYLTANRLDYPAPLGTPHVEFFRDGLRELGYVEGQNIQIEYRFAELHFDELPRLAAELVGLPVDVLVLGDTRSIQPARGATTTIPIVLVLSTDPVFSGHVQSLARPGRNVTGLTMAPLETMGKRLELLRDAMPSLSHAAMLFNSGDGLAQRGSAEVARVAASLGLAYEELPVRQPEDLAGAVERASADGVDGLVVWGDPLVNQYAPQLAQLAIAARLPAIGVSREVADAGVLMAYAPSLPALFHRAAAYVDKIVRGGRPAEIPVERPTQFELVLNLRTAGALGLSLNEELRREATDVIR